MMTLLLAAILSQAQVAAPAQRATAQPAPAAPALTIGSKAPLPEISDFIRGEKPTFFEPGKVYVLEFWATWCGPCRQGMPHLTKVAEEMKPKGVVVVGISDEKPDTVRSFLEKDEWKQKARYILATDPDRSTQRDYMEAAGQNGIPTAFIVKEGVVQWIGHPMEMDEPLAKIVAGTWDPKAAKQGFEDEAAEQMKVMAKQNAMTKAMESKDWDKALGMLDAEIAAATAAEALPWKVQKAQVLLMAGRSDAGYALCEEIAAKDPSTRPWLAMSVLRMPEIPDRRVDVAITWLEAARADAGAKASPQVLSELGNAWAMKGDYAKAKDCLQQAISAAKAMGPQAADYVAAMGEELKAIEAKAAGGAVTK